MRLISAPTARSPVGRRASTLLAALVVSGVAWLSPGAAGAQEAQAVEAARNANCTPGRVELLESRPGPGGHTLYLIQCQGARTAGANPGAGGSSQATGLRVSCRGFTCFVLGPCQGAACRAGN